jgi:hypothetical protein
MSGAGAGRSVDEVFAWIAIYEDGTEAICIAVADGHPYQLVSSNHERAASMARLAERVKERTEASSVEIARFVRAQE